MSRKRWVYTQGGVPLPEPIEVGEEWRPLVDQPITFTDSYMDGVVAPDGTDIGSRKKRREYMYRNGLADSSDFKGTFEKARAEREKYFTGEAETKERREVIGRALYEHETKKRRR